MSFIMTLTEEERAVILAMRQKTRQHTFFDDDGKELPPVQKKKTTRVKKAAEPVVVQEVQNMSSASTTEKEEKPKKEVKKAAPKKEEKKEELPMPKKEIDGTEYWFDPETNGLYPIQDGGFGALVGYFQPDNEDEPIRFTESPTNFDDDGKELPPVQKKKTTRVKKVVEPVVVQEVQNGSSASTTEKKERFNWQKLITDLKLPAGHQLIFRPAGAFFKDKRKDILCEIRFKDGEPIVWNAHLDSVTEPINNSGPTAVGSMIKKVLGAPGGKSKSCRGYPECVGSNEFYIKHGDKELKLNDDAWKTLEWNGNSFVARKEKKE